MLPPFDANVIGFALNLQTSAYLWVCTTRTFFIYLLQGLRVVTSRVRLEETVFQITDDHFSSFRTERCQDCDKLTFLFVGKVLSNELQISAKSREFQN